MKVIITHEQADFDAIASLLGAYLTMDDMLPVLPHKVNRNVKDFLEKYASSFPFRPVSVLPKEPIEKVTLVDTQSLITLKGISKKTTISAIDHHEKKINLPENWDLEYVPYGANTTYFVEALQKNNNYELNVMEATLLLLGIYEDTGLLTYTNTTPHDASAVAYLLSQKANLEIAADYLNPPLSSAQQIVFQSLLENSRHINIFDLNILIASASAMNLDDEVSSIAHKINDLFEPDALFIFIALEEGIRLVARSSTNRVDTAKIARIYGGGGHRRASAALIDYENMSRIDLPSILDDFEATLQDQILPAVRVRNIMSKKPLTLNPETTVKEARSLMEQYGYEGFPVLKNNKIIGLLNRRAVDKAYKHNLEKTASSLMEAGEFFVNKNDTIEHLQKVMSQSGWGQIPVISRTNDEVIGIVTRTDLLKAITGDQRNNHHRNLTKALKKNTSSAEFSLLELVSQTATEMNMPIYIVGGFVRDILLERPSPDFDIVVEGDAILLSDKLANKYGGRITSHKKFGTAKWWPLDKPTSNSNAKLPISEKQLNETPSALDLISARTEFYEKPTALPTIKQSSIKLDLHRRDFTINTMAIRLDGDHFGDLNDFWGGLNDLENGLVRVLHSLSFVDDPTRMLRAVRFEKRFDFEIEKRTLELLREAVPLIDEVSGDRIRHELDQIFLENVSEVMLERLQNLGILQQIHPSLRWNSEYSAELRSIIDSSSEKKKMKAVFGHEDSTVTATYIILVCRLLPAHLNKVAKRLRFRSDTQRILYGANTLWHHQEQLSRLSPGEFTERIEKYSPLTLEILLSISKNQKFIAKLNQYLTEWSKIKIFTSGDDLKKLEIPPGPIYRQILKQLRIAKVNGEISDRSSEKKHLDQLIARMS
jgi:tRNA nucleotidyltransferase (CCA-adding enzyme)